MSIKLFQGPRNDLSVTSFPHNHSEAQAGEPIAAAGGAMVWLGVCFALRQEGSPKSHKTAPVRLALLRVFSWIVLRGERQSLKKECHYTAQSNVRLGRDFAVALSCLALLTCLASIASAQRRIEIRVLPDASGRVTIDGSCAPSAEWSFRDSYAGVLNLGSRIEGLRLFDAAGAEVSNRTIAPGQFQATAAATRFHYEAKLPTPARAADAARVSWLTAERGLLMLRDLLPARPSGASANPDTTEAAVVRLVLPPGWSAYSNDNQNGEGEFESSDVDLTVFAVGRTLRATTAAVSGMKLNLVLAGEWAFADAEAVELASKVLKAHREVFGSAPSQQATLILFPFPQTGVADQWSAETRGSSVTLLAARLPSKVAALAQLSVPLAHEFLHFWVPNGLTLTGDYDWFYEGFTVYQAARISVRLDLLTFQEFLNAISRAYDGYSFGLDRDRWSLLEASKRRWTAGEASIYSKSMVIAFLYDLNLRTLSRNKHSLDEVYRNLFREYHKEEARARGGAGLQGGQGSDGNEAVLHALGFYSGMRSFAGSFVSNAVTINLTEMLAPFGLRAETFGLRTRISASESLTRQQRDLLHDLGYNDYVRSPNRRKP
ncbi:MAG: hypothetical protein QOI77_3808 [Blastocatellia bacterium]|nr:hypothetical protein [Blastocatellia bacterium]